MSSGYHLAEDVSSLLRIISIKGLIKLGLIITALCIGISVLAQCSREPVKPQSQPAFNNQGQEIIPPGVI